MNGEDRDIDARIERLGRATEAIGPTAGFSSRVMARVAAERRPGWAEAVRLSSRRLLPVFAVAAVLALLAALKGEASVDEALASAYDTPELEW